MTYILVLRPPNHLDFAESNKNVPIYEFLKLSHFGEILDGFSLEKEAGNLIVWRINDLNLS